MNENLRKRLLAMITRNGIRPSHVAGVIGVDRSFITHFLKGKVGMSVMNQQKLKDYLERGIING